MGVFSFQQLPLAGNVAGGALSMGCRPKSECCSTSSAEAWSLSKRGPSGTDTPGTTGGYTHVPRRTWRVSVERYASSGCAWMRVRLAMKFWYL